MKSLSPSFISIFSWSLFVAARVVCAGPTPVSNPNSQQLDEQQPNELSTELPDGGGKPPSKDLLKKTLQMLLPAELEWFCAGGDDCVVWFPGRWGACSENGSRIRTVDCFRIRLHGERGYVDDSNCTNAGLKRPAFEQECNRRSRAEWAFGAWSTCTAQCGDAGRQYRSVLCSDEAFKPLKATECEGARPTGETKRFCTLPSCEAYDFSAPVLAQVIDTSKNVTRCAMTPFGCCQDSYTPARGEYFEGCPFNEYGSCDLSVFGCCADGVTLARGPNHEGCGRVPCWPRCCQATLFGCCPDQTSIALGPNDAGCNRLPVHCERTIYGCCPDGETVAQFEERCA